MSASRVANDGKVTALGGKAEPDEVVTEADVQDPSKLARMLARVLAGLAALRREFRPRRVDFHDITTASGGGVVQLQHNFKGRVVWWLIDYQLIGAAAAPIIQRAPATDANTLVLLTYTTGIASFRVEEAG